MGATNNGGWSLFAWMLIVGTLISGTVSGITSKVLYSYKADGTCGNHKFNKPFFLTMAMFIGEAICLLFYYGGRYLEKRKLPLDANDHHQFHQLDTPNHHHHKNVNNASVTYTGSHNLSSTLLDNEFQTSPSSSSKSSINSSLSPPKYYYGILSLFDLTATCLGLVGLKFIDLSTYSMLRGSMVVFTVIFSALIMKTKYTPKQWGTIFIVVSGLTVVGCTGFARAKNPASDTPPADSDDSVNSLGDQAIGIALVLLGSALNACQNVVEELLLKKYTEGPNPVHPLEVVGWEGCFGLFFSSIILLPILTLIPGSDCDKAEDTLDTLHQLQDGGVVGLVIPYLLALAFMNWSSVAISQVLTAVHRQLVSACRTVLIWMIDIIIYYKFSHTYGEFWDQWSFLQLGGFVLLLVGTLLYSLVSAAEREKQSNINKINNNTNNNNNNNNNQYDVDDLHALAEHDKLHYTNHHILQGDNDKI